MEKNAPARKITLRKSGQNQTKTGVKIRTQDLWSRLRGDLGMGDLMPDLPDPENHEKPGKFPPPPLPPSPPSPLPVRTLIIQPDTLGA